MTPLFPSVGHLEAGVQVAIGSENINHWLVREGLAWRYDRYSKSEELLRLQDEARKLKKGLWNDGKPIPPWEFRSAKVQRVR